MPKALQWHGMWFYLYYERGREDIIELTEKLWCCSGDCHLLGVKVWMYVAKGVALPLLLEF